ncbi:MAG: PQQ-like beta-propeller repeat protein [Acidobacteria bacterium]|nr:PQQ-like beta-propeller repeat protein [Acidobacteriota bacterium]
MRILSIAIMVFSLGGLYGQRGGNDWMTAGFDAQRSNWVRGDAKINIQSMSQPGFTLDWKLKVKNTPRQFQSVTPPALLDFFIGHVGFRALGFVGGGDTVTGIDTDLARAEWERSLSAPSKGVGTPACPGGMTSTVTRPTVLGYAPMGGAAGRGRGRPGVSGVGEPGEGAVTLRDRPQVFTPPPAPKPVPGAKPVAAPPSPFAARVQWVNAIAGDGKFHSMYVSNGESPNPPVPFLSAGAHARGLMVFGGTAYAATVNSCGGVPNGLWALNIESKIVSSWKAPGNVAGAYGFAAGPDGTLYVSSGTEVTALEAETLNKKGSFQAGKALGTSPVVFEHNGAGMLAVATADGELHVIDAGSLSGVAKVSVEGAANYSMGSVLSFIDGAQRRLLLAPAAKNIVAYEFTGSALIKRWTSKEMVSPLTPIAVTSIVFALSSGEHRSASIKDTMAKSSNAVLYAIDPVTGKELWSSGDKIQSFVTSGGLAAGGARVYVSTYDGTQYAFGFPIEH